MKRKSFTKINIFKILKSMSAMGFQTFKTFLLLLLILSCSVGDNQGAPLGATQKIFISSQGDYSTKAGLEIFKQGGNIFDAFAAVSFALSVERPQSTGIGGGGFALIYFRPSDRVVAYDFREVAPLKSKPSMYLNEKGEIVGKESQDGPRAVATPGLIKGILEIQKNFGKLNRASILRPAIELAENGFKVYPHLARAIERRSEVLKKWGGEKIFFKENGEPLKEGDLLVQKDLAHTLKILAQQGEESFYHGELALALSSQSQQAGGELSLEDLKSYEMKSRTPLMGMFEGYQIFTMPPPSSGGVHVLQVLNILGHYPLGQLKNNDPGYLNLLASSLQIAFADRAKYLGDPDFESVPVSTLTSRKYAGEALHLLSLKRKISSKSLPAKEMEIKESQDTTHFSIIDGQGNVISSTQTINGLFGSGFIPKGLGIVMNNEMDDFTVKVGAQNIFGAVGGEKNKIIPLKRPLSSMSPTIVFRQGKPVYALGSPSGTRIISCVSQVLLNLLGFKMTLDQAVSAPRLHHQWYPERLQLEPQKFSLEIVDQLKAMGHEVEESDLGCRVQSVMKQGDMLWGVADPRGEGLAAGL